GTASVTYTVSSRCGNTICVDNFTILNSPPPISGPSIGCTGSTITLTDSVTGGIWRGSNPTVAAVAAGFGTVTGLTAGIDTITYIAPSGCVTKKVITVYNAPRSITGTSSVCPGATTVLNNPTPGGSWTSANPSIATVSNTGIVTGVSANTTTISYTLFGSLCSATMPFTVNPLPSFIQGTAAFCANATDSLFNLTRGGTWSVLPSSVASIDTGGVLTGISGGTANVTYTMPTGCKVSRAITVRPTPNPTITINFSSGSFFTESYFTSYQWFRNGVALPGGNTPMIGAPFNGLYTVHVVDTFGCENTSAPYNFTQVAVPGVTRNTDVSIYPNPAASELNVVCAEHLDAVIGVKKYR
ncbi:MAG: hypothetical protein EBZ77_16110, partial [Chitinophagia bacterium]|nr:hypothetical protein [Chitinophagia bacterium]